ncbi:MAG: hypothetical protein RSE97_07575, partial [Oscillospiraceae bacterium]
MNFFARALRGALLTLNLTLSLNLTLFLINRNMVAHIRQCAHWLPQRTVSLFLREKRNGFLKF